MDEIDNYLLASFSVFFDNSQFLYAMQSSQEITTAVFWQSKIIVLYISIFSVFSGSLESNAVFRVTQHILYSLT